MKILGLDLASKTGWAILDGAGIVSGTWDCSPRRGDSTSMRLIYLRAQLRRIATESPKLVVYEAALAHGGPGSQAAAIAHELAGVLKTWCHDEGIPHHAVHVSTLKKWATGRGNAKKPEMVAAAEAVLGRKVKDDNEADAVHLARYGWDVVLETSSPRIGLGAL